jgi:hypothetical protein
MLACLHASAYLHCTHVPLELSSSPREPHPPGYLTITSRGEKKGYRSKPGWAWSTFCDDRMTDHATNWPRAMAAGKNPATCGSETSLARTSAVLGVPPADPVAFCEGRYEDRAPAGHDFRHAGSDWLLRLPENGQHLAPFAPAHFVWFQHTNQVPGPSGLKTALWSRLLAI